MSDFHRAYPEMARLRLCRITIELTETENCYILKFKQRVALVVELSIYNEVIVYSTIGTSIVYLCFKMCTMAHTFL